MFEPGILQYSIAETKMTRIIMSYIQTSQSINILPTANQFSYRVKTNKITSRNTKTKQTINNKKIHKNEIQLHNYSGAEW